MSIIEWIIIGHFGAGLIVALWYCCFDWKSMMEIRQEINISIIFILGLIIVMGYIIFGALLCDKYRYIKNRYRHE